MSTLSTIQNIGGEKNKASTSCCSGEIEKGASRAVDPEPQAKVTNQPDLEVHAGRHNPQVYRRPWHTQAFLAVTPRYFMRVYVVVRLQVCDK